MVQTRSLPDDEHKILGRTDTRSLVPSSQPTLQHQQQQQEQPQQSISSLAAIATSGLPDKASANQNHNAQSSHFLTTLDELAQVLAPRSSLADNDSTGVMTYQKRHEPVVSLPGVSVVPVTEVLDAVPLKLELPPEYEMERKDEETDQQVWMGHGQLGISIQELEPLVTLESDESRSRSWNHLDRNWRAYDCDGYYVEKDDPRLFSYH